MVSTSRMLSPRAVYGCCTGNQHLHLHLRTMDAERSRHRVVIAGGSGFLGRSLATHLVAAGHSVAVLSRNAPTVAGPWRHVAWDARTLGDWCHELSGAAGVVNLVGRSVDCIKTPDHRDEILRSRVEA